MTSSGWLGVSYLKTALMEKISMQGKLIVGISIALVWAFISCASNPSDVRVRTSPHQIRAQESERMGNIPEYCLQRGDEIEIKFFYNPSLNERLVIRPDGKISLQLIDELFVTGLTPSQLDKILTKTYATEIKNPELTVIVRSFTGQRVYIGGEVTLPQLIPLTAKMTVLQSIFRAGGFRDTAHPGSVIVIRKGADNHPFGIKIDLTKVMKGKEGARDIELLPYDIVYVPKKMISKVDLFVDQYIRQVLPFTSGASIGFSYELRSQPARVEPFFR